MATRKRTEVTLADQERVLHGRTTGLTASGDPKHQIDHDELARKLANGWTEANDPAHKNLYDRWERGLARRLYEVWRTAGQLGGERWEWSNQSTQAQAAWRAVARAVAGPAMQEQFGVAEIAALTHG